MIDEILEYNKKFVSDKGYLPYVTDKYPKKKVAILTCMDTRLTTMLPAALGLKNGDAKIIKNAGGIISHPFDSAMRSLLVGVYELGVMEIMVVAHTDCGACHLDSEEMKRLMLKRGILPSAFEFVKRLGIPLDRWLDGFHETERSVRNTVNTIRLHPLMPSDVTTHGFIIDSATGELREVAVGDGL